MQDQAKGLRQLVLAGTQAPGAPGRRFAAARSSAAPHLLVVSGGKGGVGTTTIAVNLSIALAQSGWRTVLVDADLDGADASTLCRQHGSYTVADVLSGRRTVHETLEQGPAGIQVLPGAWALGRVADCSPAAQERLIGQLARLGPHAEFVVVDAGSGLGHVVQRYWQAADGVLLVTSPEAVSVMDAYAAVKAFAGGGDSVPVRSLVNLAPDAAVAADTHRRLARACQRFLALALAAAGHVPADPQVAQAGALRRPFLVDFPRSAAAAALEQLAESLAAGSRSTKSPGIDSTRGPVPADP